MGIPVTHDSASMRAAEALFDLVDDTVFFVKDSAGRYTAVNTTLVRRLGRKNKADVIGKSVAELFPPELGSHMSHQDLEVLRLGKTISAQLELHLFRHGRQGWCLTWKEPIRGALGKIVGLCGISRDIQTAQNVESDLSALSEALAHIRSNLDQPLPLPELAGMAGLSVYQLDRRIRGLFGLSAAQYVARARIDHACNRLRQTDQPIGDIALECGYGDQSAFSRQFRRTVGLTPGVYRETSQD